MHQEDAAEKQKILLKELQNLLDTQKTKKRGGNMMKLKKEEMLALSYFRENARIRLTKLSRLTEMPVSTLHDRIEHKFPELIDKFTVLFNFPKLEYFARAYITLKVDKKQRNIVKEFFEKQACVNNLYKVNNGYDFMAEVVFRNIKELEIFIETLDEKFVILEKNIYYVIEDIKREAFLSEPQLVKMQE